MVCLPREGIHLMPIQVLLSRSDRKTFRNIQYTRSLPVLSFRKISKGMPGRTEDIHREHRLRDLQILYQEQHLHHCQKYHISRESPHRLFTAGCPDLLEKGSGTDSGYLGLS